MITRVRYGERRRRVGCRGKKREFQYPMRTKSNYLTWSIKLKVSMHAQEIWDAVELDYPKVPM